MRESEVNVPVYKFHFARILSALVSRFPIVENQRRFARFGRFGTALLMRFFNNLLLLLIGCPCRVVPLIVSGEGKV